MISHADCEMLVEGFLKQPANALTTLAFVVAGVFVLIRPRMRWVGWGLVATGVGSFIFHGPMPSWGEWIHDVTMVWLILIIAGLGRRWERFTQLPGLAALSVLLAFTPALGDPLAVALTALAVVGLMWRDRSPALFGSMMLLAGAAVLGRMGTSEGPWCEPDSFLQPHGAWHVGAAIAVAWWALSWDEAQ